jgi:hypothetical protein
VYASDGKRDEVTDDRKNLYDRYDPFYIYAAAERLLAEKDSKLDDSGSESADGGAR